ncbi:MAG: class F sortase [Pseudonocardia sp.]|nr:class F sortase [Pseudonocardia sp.]
MSRLAVLVALLCALAGCGATASAPAAAPVAPPRVAAAVPAAVPVPVAVSIPAIGAASTLVGLGLNPDGTLAVPPTDRPGQASWFAEGVTPGEDGPAVIAGHVNGRVDGVSTPGVFARLAELRPGDEILVDQTGGTLVWEVVRVARHDKDNFPTAAVYGDTAGPTLRLITCGGRFDTATGHYEDNVVVFAVPA